MTRIAIGVFALAALCAHAQITPIPKPLTLHEYSNVIRHLGRDQQIANVQLQEGAAEAVRTPGVPMTVAMEKLANIYTFYTNQLKGIEKSYRSVKPPRSALPLHRVYVEGNQTLIELTQKLVPPLRKHDERALKGAKAALSSFAANYAKRVKEAIVSAGLDYDRYVKDGELVLKKKR